MHLKAEGIEAVERNSMELHTFMKEHGERTSYHFWLLSMWPF